MSYSDDGGIIVGDHQILSEKIDSPISFVASKVQGAVDDGLLRVPLWHEQLEIKYFLRGGAQVNCGGNCILSKSGDMVVINPCEYHSTEMFPGREDAVYHLMIIDLEHPCVRSLAMSCPELFRNRGRSGVPDDHMPYFRNLIEDGRLPCVRLFLLLAEECAREGSSFGFYEENLLRSFLYSLIRDAANWQSDTRDSERRRASTRLLIPAMRYIDLNYQQPISLENLASCCALSLSRFSHLFREITGMTAVGYINSFRVSKACVLLGATEMSVAEAAFNTGFQDPAYFSRVFRRVCGCSPAEYRKRKRQPAAT